MKALICHDDVQLRRIESAIAAIESAFPCDRQNKLALLRALEVERASLLQYTQRARAATHRAAQPKPRKRLAWLEATPRHQYAIDA